MKLETYVLEKRYNNEDEFEKVRSNILEFSNEGHTIDVGTAYPGDNTAHDSYEIFMGDCHLSQTFSYYKHEKFNDLSIQIKTISRNHSKNTIEKLEEILGETLELKKE